MIVAKRKPLAEIREMLGDAERVLVAGCGTCVAVCMAGGEKEAGVLASQLKLAAGVDGREIVVDQTTLERQCDREFLDQLARRIGDYDAVVSLACGAGIQFLGEAYPEARVVPGVDTVFIGVAEEAGLWTERCRACGACRLGTTAGICPLTMCAKGLTNGPCGGMKNGMCEVNPDQACAWVRIWERLEAADRIDDFNRVRPPVDHGASRSPGRVVHAAYKRRFTVTDGDV